ncbi:MAG: hypothetical protein JXA23_10640 [Bacteroidales bacterium]|nr:hypothetical protein [Bacteroidales bacterium]
MKRFVLILIGFRLLLLPCLVQSQSLTNVGTDFWVAFPPNWSNPNLYLFISSNYATSGTISSPFPGVGQDFSVSPGIVSQIAIPSTIALQSGIEDKGIHITSLDPISLYGLNRVNASTDAYLALPVNALGADYRILNYIVTLNNAGSSLSVVATHDGTVVTIYNRQSGDIFDVTLNTGQTYHLESPILGDDLTGSRIQATHPVAVFGSNEIVNVPSFTCGAADHIIEQMFPTYSWGKNFVTVPLAGRDDSGDIFRILASENDTDIEIDGTLVSTIDAGEHYQENLLGYNSISTSKPVLLAQYAKGMNCSGNMKGDPFMMLIPPREQFLTNYTVSTVSGFNEHWINIVAPDYALGTILQNGVLIPVSAFLPVGTTGFYGAQRSVSEGSHTFSSPFPFGVFSYGWGYADSYGYPGGGSLSPVATVDSVALSPDTLYGELNVTSVCLTATVLNTLGNPVEGILVNFVINGISPLTGNAYSNAAGEAHYCYTRNGTVAGTDTIYAEVFGFTSDTSLVFWSYLPPCVNPTAAGTIGSGLSSCGPLTPAVILNMISPSGYTGTLEYRWQSSGVGATTGFADIPDSNSPSLTLDTVAQTTWIRRLCRVDCMPDWSGADTSNVVEIVIIPQFPVAISITASGIDICAGTLVSFTASTQHKGLTPLFSWQVNGISAGTNDSVFSYIPINGDLVLCILASSESCTSNNPDTSNAIVMVVYPVLPVGITIAPDVNPICDGLPITFTGVAVNSGPTPVYQWQVNGINAGTNSSIFTYIPTNNDQVTCTLTSSEPCTTSNPATSNELLITVLPAPAVTFTPCFDTITVTNAKPIRLRGGIPLGGVFSGTGVSDGFFYPALAGPGIHEITYKYSNEAGCEDSSFIFVFNFQFSIFNCGDSLTDIRDNQQYPTVQIGSQCWFTENLIYGTEIPFATPQRDNCIPEKYENPAASSEQLETGYQWDELMTYTESEEAQGLCPPGWHVPSEIDWNQLFSFYQNNGFAGSPLKYTGYSGFNAFLNGTVFFNRDWYFEDFATFFWSSTSHGPFKAWAHGMNEENYSVSFYPAFRANAFSVRCLRD